MKRSMPPFGKSRLVPPDIRPDWFSQLYGWIGGRRWSTLVSISILVIAALIGLRFVSFDADFDLIIPQNNQVRRCMRFLRESKLSDRVVLSFGLVSPEYTKNDLLQSVDALAETLKPPQITKIIGIASEANIMEEMLEFLSFAPQILDESALKEANEQITPDGVKKKMAENFRQLLTPASAVTIPFIRADPLGVKTGILSSLKTLSSSSGFDLLIENGHLVSKDGRHAMLVLETPVPLTDADGTRKLISYLRKQLKALPEFVSTDIIAAHLHTISNEEVVKRDVRLTIIIVSAAFLFLFLFVFKDIRAITIFIMPLVAVLMSINVSSFLLGSISHVAVGMGAVVIGIAADYGIHTYMAVRMKGPGADSIRAVAKPITIGALTTLGVFASLVFSSVIGYHHLALFATISIALCLAGALLILPQFWRAGDCSRFPGAFRFDERPSGAFPDYLLVALWGIIVLGALFFTLGVKFDSDVNQFDGSEPEIKEAERRFHDVWGGRDRPAILVCSGKTLEDALQLEEDVSGEATRKLGQKNFTRLTSVWPSKRTRGRNLARWNDFWRAGREAKLADLLREHGSEHHFSLDAFAPFFDDMYPKMNSSDWPEGLSFFESLKDQFVLKKDEGYQVLSYFPDDESSVSALTKISEHHSGTFIVSRSALSQAISDAVFSELLYLSAIAAVIIPLLTLLLLRRVKLAAIALVPVVSSLLIVLGAIPLFGMRLNAARVVAALVVVGLSIDYGVFMVYACHNRLRIGTSMAICISMLTTVIGAGALLFAKHALLFSIGQTLVIGVLAGYITSILVVPSLYRLWARPQGSSCT
ncbi:hypothetical protein J7M28_10785 [bacterium]|nr:hypothetical protein [bacterium]